VILTSFPNTFSGKAMETHRSRIIGKGETGNEPVHDA